MKNITVALDQERAIKYTINAMVDLEERFDVPVTALFSEGKIGLTVIRSLLCVGLKYGGAKFAGTNAMEHEEFVGDLIQQHWLSKGKPIDDLMSIIIEAFIESGILPQKAEAEEDSENPTVGG